ncbi:uncharacterized protein V1516DRAFT_671843 [Lipomyces oligophaga]|uniref:uncharacterized protein n=1 Tax=Lipomyces oligophaga TaxID=45792 RepID=UPI0034CDD6CE
MGKRQFPWDKEIEKHKNVLEGKNRKVKDVASARETVSRVNHEFDELSPQDMKPEDMKFRMVKDELLEIAKIWTAPLYEAEWNILQASLETPQRKKVEIENASPSPSSSQLDYFMTVSDVDSDVRRVSRKVSALESKSNPLRSPKRAKEQDGIERLLEDISGAADVHQPKKTEPWTQINPDRNRSTIEKILTLQERRELREASIRSRRALTEVSSMLHDTEKPPGTRKLD